jgi:hypothetical protein
VNADGGEGVELLAGVDWRIGFPFAPDAASPGEAAMILARCVGAQLRWIAGSTGALSRDYAVCSSISSPLFDRDPQHAASFFDEIERASGVRPLGFVRAYECSIWGFALDFFCRQTDARQVLLTLVDVELQNWSHFAAMPLWGRSNFGITTLLLEIPAARDVHLVTGGTEPGRVFIEFTRAIKRHRRDGRRNRTFLPFLREDMRRLIERGLGQEKLAPDRWAEYGHCFEADPWIGIMRWIMETPPAQRETVTVGSLSYGGYYTVCDVVLSPSVKVELRSLAGDDDALARR